MSNTLFDSGLGIFDRNHVSSKRKLHIIYHVNSWYRLQLISLGRFRRNLGVIMGYTITSLYLSGLICVTLVCGKLKRIGIESGTQVGDSSNPQVASIPTQETTENKY